MARGMENHPNSRSPYRLRSHHSESDNVRQIQVGDLAGSQHPVPTYSTPRDSNLPGPYPFNGVELTHNTPYDWDHNSDNLQAHWGPSQTVPSNINGNLTPIPSLNNNDCFSYPDGYINSERPIISGAIPRTNPVFSGNTTSTITETPINRPRDANLHTDTYVSHGRFPYRDHNRHPQLMIEAINRSSSDHTIANTSTNPFLNNSALSNATTVVTNSDTTTYLSPPSFHATSDFARSLVDQLQNNLPADIDQETLHRISIDSLSPFPSNQSHSSIIEPDFPEVNRIISDSVVRSTSEGLYSTDPEQVISLHPHEPVLNHSANSSSNSSSHSSHHVSVYSSNTLTPITEPGLVSSVATGNVHISANHSVPPLCQLNQTGPQNTLIDHLQWYLNHNTSVMAETSTDIVDPTVSINGHHLSAPVPSSISSDPIHSSRHFSETTIPPHMYSVVSTTQLASITSDRPAQFAVSPIVNPVCTFTTPTLHTNLNYPQISISETQQPVFTQTHTTRVTAPNFPVVSSSIAPVMPTEIHPPTLQREIPSHVPFSVTAPAMLSENLQSSWFTRFPPPLISTSIGPHLSSQSVQPSSNSNYMHYSSSRFTNPTALNGPPACPVSHSFIRQPIAPSVDPNHVSVPGFRQYAFSLPNTTEPSIIHTTSAPTNMQPPVSSNSNSVRFNLPDHERPSSLLPSAEVPPSSGIVQPPSSQEIDYEILAEAVSRRLAENSIRRSRQDEGGQSRNQGLDSVQDSHHSVTDADHRTDRDNYFSSSSHNHGSNSSHSNSRRFSDNMRHTSSSNHTSFRAGNRYNSRRELPSHRADLTEQDFAVLTHQGICEEDLRERAAHTSTRLELVDLPSLPASQFVMNISADVVQEFSGKLEDYEDFRASFLAYAQSLPVHQRLLILRRKLTGKAYNMISGCIGIDDASFKKAIEILDRKFCKPILLINMLVSEIDNLLQFSCRKSNDKFATMISNIRRCYNRIFEIDPRKVLSLDGLLAKFTQCMPTKPYNDVTKLMHYNMSNYRFSNVLEICEDFVDMVDTRNANTRAARRETPESNWRQDKSPKSNLRDSLKQIKTSSGHQFTGERNQSDSVFTATDFDSDPDSYPDLRSELVSDTESCAAAPEELKRTEKVPKERKSNSYNRQSRSSSSDKRLSRTPKPNRDPSSNQRDISRSKSPGRKIYKCSLCKTNSHFSKDCTVEHPNLKEIVSANFLCRICLHAGHKAENCPILEYFPDSDMICKDASCKNISHNKKLCPIMKIQG